MSALEDEIAAALKQVGGSTAGANVPKLLEAIMGAMASGVPSGQEPGTRGGGEIPAASPFVHEILLI